MSLRQVYRGLPDGSTVPDVVLTGDPGTDQVTLVLGGYLGGRVMALQLSSTPGRGVVIVPCDGSNQFPYGFLINGPGEFAGAIGPSGSGKTPTLRGTLEILVDTQAYVAAPVAAYVLGGFLYCGTGTTAGLITADPSTNPRVLGVCTQVPTALVPWLGVASYHLPVTPIIMLPGGFGAGFGLFS